MGTPAQGSPLKETFIFNANIYIYMHLTFKYHYICDWELGLIN